MAEITSCGTVKSSRGGDLWGMCASLGCAVHCIATPFLIGYLPAAGSAVLTDQWFHVATSILCGIIGLWTFTPGYMTHGKMLPALLGLTGLTILGVTTATAPDCCAEGSCCADAAAAASTASAGFVPSGATVAHITGGLLLAAGHLLNHRHRCSCHCHDGE
ncbi:MAG: MerC domain-containing protein [Planctomycetota bacterium]